MIKLNKGVTLFIAIVVMSILLIITFAVVNITIKGTLFSSSGRDSQFAFYAANAGVECAIYWDSRFKFATSTSGSPIDCAGSTMATNDTIPTGMAIPATTTLTLIGGGGDSNPTSVFGFVMDQDSNPTSHCAIVTVLKYYDAFDNLKTYIKSRGYNTCDISNSRRLERGIEVIY